MFIPGTKKGYFKYFVLEIKKKVFKIILINNPSFFGKEVKVLKMISL